MKFESGYLRMRWTFFKWECNRKINTLGKFLGIYDWIINFKDSARDKYWIFRLSLQGIKLKRTTKNLFIFDDGSYSYRSRSFRLPGDEFLYILDEFEEK